MHLSYHCKYLNQTLVLMTTSFLNSLFVSRFCFLRNRLSVSMGFLCGKNLNACSLNFARPLL